MADKRSLLAIGVLAILKCPSGFRWSTLAGLVIAGFGGDELFPALRSFSVSGVFGGHLNYQADERIAIGFDTPACVQPFAQTDAVYTFMEGVDRGYQGEVEHSMERVLTVYPQMVVDQCKFPDDATKKRIGQEFDKVVSAVVNDYRAQLRLRRRDKFWKRIMELVAVLPKAELAPLAESMVTLTSLRRRVEEGVETVAGPVDVALISKGTSE